jgi:hypothetical protein
MMTSMPVPIARNLTDRELQQRRAGLLETFREALLETKELEAGYASRFPRMRTGSLTWLN